ncbi:DUF3696 domain-containing protein [Haliangium sp.]|uniref:DUF3696 domain-containing protein n=1 Tax=Haliangium sp. TaxID=2663208 RepID=UPI003D0A143D
MLTHLSLNSFKCFDTLELSLAPLTLLSGSNASGKSTVLQALLLLHQTICESEWSSTLTLNGNILGLGTDADVIDKINGRRRLRIGVGSHSGMLKWTFQSAERRAMNVPVQSIYWIPKEDLPILEFVADEASSTPMRRLVPLSWLDESPDLGMVTESISRLQYISAERLGPREIYPLPDSNNRQVGARGQNAPALLHWYGQKRISNALEHPKASTPTLRQQVEAWMREFFPGCGVDVQLVPNANHISLGLRTDSATDYHRPQHVGFGLSHILPIITAALVSEPGDVLLVENPEVHLHPAGQTLIGQFLGTVAASEVQVIVETHSDHVLNGIRRAVRARTLDAEHAALYYFYPRTYAAEEGIEQVVSPQIDLNGNIDHWPVGFFDQFDKDMNYFAGWED